MIMPRNAKKLFSNNAHTAVLLKRKRILTRTKSMVEKKVGQK